MKFLLALFIFFNSAITSYSQTLVDTLYLQSKFVKDGNYIVEIALPPNYQKDKAYPICYFLDLKLAEPLMKDISDSLMRHQLSSEFIFVGIKCNDTSRWCGHQRFRDYSPSYSAEFEKYMSARDTSTHYTGGGLNFLSFLKYELIPLIEEKYKSNSKRRTLFGMSFSGLFAAYVLLEEPNLFKQYILGAPSLPYNNFELVKRLEETKAKKLKSISNVYMCIGSKDNENILLAYKNFSHFLLEKKVPVVADIIPDKNHIGIWNDCLIKGIIKSFPPVQ